MIALGGRQCKYRRTKENGAFVFIHSGSELRKRTRTRMRWAITHQQVILYGKTKETKKMLLREQHVPTDRVSHWACSARRVVLFHTKRKRKQRLGPAKKKTEGQQRRGGNGGGGVGALISSPFRLCCFWNPLSAAPSLAYQPSAIRETARAAPAADRTIAQTVAAESLQILSLSFSVGHFSFGRAKQRGPSGFS